MAKNKNLSTAKSVKNDEFYTQYADIQKEVSAYLEYNPDVFRGKTVLCPCDDPEWSNFTKFFAQRFDEFGLKKLISTSYAYNSKNPKPDFDWQPTLFEFENPAYDAEKSPKHGKIFTLSDDEEPPRDLDKLKWRYLDGDGDFRSAEVSELLKEADIVVTNPPFSLFREFISWIFSENKKFLMIGNMNAITYKEVFPLIMENKLWLGATGNGSDMVFGVPEGAVVKDSDRQKAERLGYKGDYTRLGNSCWFTNMEHGRRHQSLQINKVDWNLKHSGHKNFAETGYQKYDNYDALEIPYTDLIPCDYDGVMGVPISFLDKYCPEQFEILGATQRGCHDKVPDTKKYDDYWECKPNGEKTGSSGGKTNENANLLQNDERKNYFINSEGRIIQSAYQRIFIRLKNPQK